MVQSPRKRGRRSDGAVSSFECGVRSSNFQPSKPSTYKHLPLPRRLFPNFWCLRPYFHNTKVRKGSCRLRLRLRLELRRMELLVVPKQIPPGSGSLNFRLPDLGGVLGVKTGNRFGTKCDTTILLRSTPSDLQGFPRGGAGVGGKSLRFYDPIPLKVLGDRTLQLAPIFVFSGGQRIS